VQQRYDGFPDWDMSLRAVNVVVNLLWWGEGLAYEDVAEWK
jgi:hypothetical protein